MLTVHYSHQMQTLADAFVRDQLQHRGDPLTPTKVIVQSNGLAQWLRMRIADEYDICANIQFPFMSSYLWQLVREIPGLTIPEQTPFDKPQLVWRLLSLFEQADCLQAFPALATYLAGKDAEAVFHFAYDLADVYDQYQLYRPGWLPGEQRFPGMQAGALPDSYQWQADLWQLLSNDIAQEAGQPVPTRLDWLSQLPQQLPALQAAGKLPNALTLFGINTLPPVMLQLYAAVAEYVPIALYVLNPSEMYWGDQQSAGELRRQVDDTADMNALLDSQNPLLASMGRLGRDFLDQLIELEAAGKAELTALEPTAFDTAHDLSLLQTLQQQMMEACPPQAITYPAAQLSDDRSIEINSHYRPMREVQVLHDRLLDWLQQPGVEPADILILTADIETYGPLIKQHFQSVTPRIPFAVADKPNTAAQNARDVLMSLLWLPNQRGTLTAVIDLLATPMIAQRFIPKTIEINDYFQIFEQAGARWGINAAQRRAFGSDSAVGSWSTAWHHLMASSVYADTATLGSLSEHYQRQMDDALEAQLSAFWPYYQLLDRWVTFALVGASLPAWVATLSQLLQQITSQHSDYRHEQAALTDFLARLEAVLTHLPTSLRDHVISLNAFRAYAETLWPDSEGQKGFLSGGVTIASMVPMRTIPRKIIGFLGLNDGVFPRQHDASDLDASALHYRPGDRNRRLDDRYLFIETLMSAEQKLYISYLGRDPVKNQPQPPSPVVTELIDAIARTTAQRYAEAEQQLIREYPLQPFSPGNFTDQQGSYQPRAYAMAQQLLTPGASIASAAEPLWAMPISASEQTGPETIQLSLRALQRFWQNPAREWLAHAVGAQGINHEQLPPEQELIELDGLAKAQISREQAYLLSENVDAEAAAALLSLRHLTPSGITGAALRQDFADYQAVFPGFPEAPSVRDIRLTITSAASDMVSDTISTLDTPMDLRVDLRFDLHGQVLCSAAGGLIDVTVEKQRSADPRRLFSFWCAHLLLNVDRPGCASQLWVVGHDKSGAFCEATVFPGLSEAQARAQLSNLIRGHQAGQQTLLHWLPQVSAVYCEALADEKKAPKAAAMAAKVFSDKWQYHPLLPILYPDRRFAPVDAWQQTSEQYYQPLLAALAQGEVAS